MDDYLGGLLGLDGSDERIHPTIDDTEALMTLVATLVKHRKRYGITHKQVAESMETTQSAVCDFERVGGDPRLSTILRYARATGFEIQLDAGIEGQCAPNPQTWQPLAQNEESVLLVGYGRDRT